MKMVAVGVAIALLSGAALACEKLEFAELDSMKREQLLRMRCEYRDEMFRWVDIAGAQARSGRSVTAAQVDLNRGNRCAQELDRLDRILGRKYAIQGDDKAVAIRVNDMCGAPAK